MADKLTITVTRSGKLTDVIDKAQGEWGEMIVKRGAKQVLKFDTLERRKGYVSLSAGTYYVKPHLATNVGRAGDYKDAKKKFGTSVNSLFIPDHKDFKEVKGKQVWLQFLIHAGSKITSVSGCIAPGSKGAKGTLSKSTQAMRQLFEEIHKGEKPSLVVVGDPTY